MNLDKHLLFTIPCIRFHTREQLEFFKAFDFIKTILLRNSNEIITFLNSDIFKSLGESCLYSMVRSGCRREIAVHRKGLQKYILDINGKGKDWN